MKEKVVEFADLIKTEGKKMKWLRSRDVKELLGIQDSTLQALRIRGDLPAYKLGSMWFYLEDEINEAVLIGKIRSNGN